MDNYFRLLHFLGKKTWNIHTVLYLSHIGFTEEKYIS